MNEIERNSGVLGGWNIQKNSDEYERLSTENRQIVDKYLREYPVKLGAMANELGVKVLLSTLPRGISGQIGQEDEAFVIRINRHEAKQRQRFTLAHEIAHYLLHRENINAAGSWSENVLLRSGQPLEIEYEANRLASDLVIPSALLAKVVEEYSEPITDDVIEEMAHRFGVSTVAMEIKLQML